MLQAEGNISLRKYVLGIFPMEPCANKSCIYYMVNQDFAVRAIRNVQHLSKYMHKDDLLCTKGFFNVYEDQALCKEVIHTLQQSSIHLFDRIHPPVTSSTAIAYRVAAVSLLFGQVFSLPFRSEATTGKTLEMKIADHIFFYKQLSNNDARHTLAPLNNA